MTQGNSVGEIGCRWISLRGRGGGMLSVVISLGLDLRKTPLCSTALQIVFIERPDGFLFLH